MEFQQTIHLLHSFLLHFIQENITCFITFRQIYIVEGDDSKPDIMYILIVGRAKRGVLWT